jgi:putative spermidine/putrescine transport system substrate-binding protein
MTRRPIKAAALGVAAALALLAGCSSPAVNGGSPAAQGGKNTLVIASWGGRFTQSTQQDLVAPFEKETGIDVSIVDVPGSQVTQLQAQRKAGNMQWDVMDSLSGSDAFVLAGAGLLQPLRPEQKTAYTTALGNDKVTDFGFRFANLGYVIVCARSVQKCPATVPEFFDVQNFPGRRAFPGSSPGQTTSILAQAAGRQLPMDVGELMQPLRKLKPDVKVFYTSGDQQEQLIRQGEVDMIMMYSGRAYDLEDTGTPVTINWSGTYDPGFTAQVAGAPHPEAALRFLDWVVAHPDAQAKWAEQMQYGVPSPKALQLMPPNIAQRLADYPANYNRLGQQDFSWYVQHKEEIDKAINSIIQGG